MASTYSAVVAASGGGTGSGSACAVAVTAVVIITAVILAVMKMASCLLAVLHCADRIVGILLRHLARALTVMAVGGNRNDHKT